MLFVCLFWLAVVGVVVVVVAVAVKVAVGAVSAFAA